ncbi:MAG: hypothetical protein ACTIJJ_14975 [Galactobacter sp.]|mgnify:CR=1 FL=1|uniref:hypothetical protein n=1 Tax=Galactobacter sp. TaxID=2676125 RepID=UPI0025C2CF3E|nr:hypothetical protein [Galactobacter sp.]
MKKLFWVAVGIGIGVLASRQLARVKTTSATAPLAIADSALDRVTSLVRGAASSFKEGSATREAELRAALGIDEAPRGRHAGPAAD